MRRHATQPESAPVSMRTVILDIQTDGSMTVTIDGASYLPEEGAWVRASFPQIIDHASDERTVPVRVEVHEADGTSFTELLPARSPRPEPAAEPAPKRKKDKPASPALIEITGEGFVAGEDVACCVIVSHTDATPHGTARAVLEPKQVKGVGEVVLVGRISGTVVTRRLP
ncbi:hypothetical protein [Brevibacterium sp. FAM 24630]|uniref:hypothetical protein n=1 Tax=Brevibacterium sp. FAM 24630 TaxID=3415680 RepID=UPI003C7B66DB